MCAQNGVVYKGYTEWTGDKLSYVRKYILCKCADRRIDSKNIDEGCGTAVSYTHLIYNGSCILSAYVCTQLAAYTLSCGCKYSADRSYDGSDWTA